MAFSRSSKDSSAEEVLLFDGEERNGKLNLDGGVEAWNVHKQ